MSVAPAEHAPHEAPAARVMFVLRDVDAVRRVAGSLGYLSARKRQVFVGVQHDPPGATSLASFDRAYVGLSVARLPNAEDDGWQSLAATVRGRLDRLTAAGTIAHVLQGVDRAVPPSHAALALLERQAPNVLVVGRLSQGAHRDYLRAARQLGVPSVFITLHMDDLARGALALDLPDAVAVWNRAQRREAVDRGVPVRRTAIIGAHLWTDVLDVREAPSRDEFCRELGIDPSRRLFVAAPGGDHASGATWFADWNAARAASSDARVRDAAVVLVLGPGTSVPPDLEWPGAAAVIAAGADLAGQYEAARVLDAALACADAVVTGDESIALEGLARAVPVLAQVGHPEVDRLTAAAGAHGSRLDAALSRDALAAARAFVRPHGDEVEPGFLLARVVKEVEPRAPSAAVPAPRPGLAAWAAARRWPARPSARSRVVGSPVGLFLVALPATGAAHWRVLFEVLAERGHRLALVAEHDELPLAETVAGVHGVWVAGRLGARATSAAERAVAALDLRLPDLSGADAAAELRWRRRVDGVTLPPALRGLEALTGRTATLQRVRDQRDVLDRSLAPSPAARRLVDREGPDAVVVLPSLDPAVAVDSWVAHLDLARAARARNIPVAISRLGAGAVEEALAQGALRPNGVSRSTAGAIADELETWLRAGAPVRRRPVFAALSRLRARAALSMIAGAAGVRRGVSVRMRPEPGGRPRGAR